MKALTSVSIKALLKKVDGKVVYLTAAQIAKQLEAKTEDDKKLISLYCDNLVSNDIIVKSEDGKFFLGDKPVSMFRVKHVLDEKKMQLEELVVTREEVDVRSKDGWRRGKLATKLAVKKEINEHAKLLKEKLEEVFGSEEEDQK